MAYDFRVNEFVALINLKKKISKLSFFANILTLQPIPGDTDNHGETNECVESLMSPLLFINLCDVNDAVTVVSRVVDQSCFLLE